MNETTNNTGVSESIQVTLDGRLAHWLSAHAEEEGVSKADAIKLLLDDCLQGMYGHLKDFTRGVPPAVVKSSVQVWLAALLQSVVAQ